MKIRKFRSEDAASVARMHRNTIRAVNAKDYNPRQILVWSKRASAANLRKSMKKVVRFVAIEKKKIIGFGDFTKEGYVHGLYVHKDWQGKGTGAALLRKIESVAKKKGVRNLDVTSTVTAKTFYEMHGYKFVRKSRYMMNGVRYTVYVLRKKL